MLLYAIRAVKSCAQIHDMAPFFVFLGGGLGSLCRYGLGQLFPTSSSHYGTLIANVLACLSLGIIIGSFGKGLITDQHRLLLATGFCGGFSTFSTLSLELVQLHDTQGLITTVGHLTLSIVLGIVSVLLGLWITGYLATGR